MGQRVVLVGHCGADGSYLRITIKSAAKDAVVVDADAPHDLERMIEQGVDLILFNRELDYGFPQSQGVEAIRELKQTHPDVKMMLVSNYPEAQAAAVAAGALPGFGKRELGSRRVVELLCAALGGKGSKDGERGA